MFAEDRNFGEGEVEKKRLTAHSHKRNIPSTFSNASSFFVFSMGTPRQIVIAD
jgi:hypothetical protein